MIKRAITTFIILLILANSSCQENYPELEDGLYAEFVTTKDTMIAKLFFDKVPVTVANFVSLAEGKHPLVKDEYKGKPFYDGITFHRVMNNFMIQAGDPTATGSGDIGYKFEDEFKPDLKHDKPGILSMANVGALATNGSQFFITEKPTPWLNAYDENNEMKNCGAPRVSCHTVFGELVKGIEIQDSISNVKVAKGHKPVEDVIINKVNIIRKGINAKKFDAAKVFSEELPKLKERIAIAKEEKERKAEAARKEAKAKAELARAEFLKKNERLTGRRIESPTGITMIFTKESNGEKPTSAQRVNIDCAGYFEDGELFWTTIKSVAEKHGKYDQNQDSQNGYKPFDRAYNKNAGLIAGFKEAMLNMKIGDKARVFIPYYLGYGEMGSPPVIPPMANLVFDIELVSIK